MSSNMRVPDTLGDGEVKISKSDALPENVAVIEVSGEKRLFDPRTGSYYVPEAQVDESPSVDDEEFVLTESLFKELMRDTAESDETNTKLLDYLAVELFEIDPEEWAEIRDVSRTLVMRDRRQFASGTGRDS